ncbi:MAG: 2OG-Fe(II) oxygenase [Cytophagales bacterium]|nr:2OG-Fe(II) oxygenase [Cytophagales bacterium]MDW8383715.1 2OG-Fe(II) oxygenase [Flammeovirgaceae bacterium]
MNFYEYRFNRQELLQKAEELAPQYQKAYPFPHIVIDNFFDDKILEQVLEEFPDAHQIDWQRYNSPNERKLACNKEEEFGNKTLHFIHMLNSSIFIEFLEKLTGIQNLIPDQNLIGGGLHQILPGGLLKIHADFNLHPKTKLSRRLNVLIYLNKNWKEEYGGHFELWDTEMKACRVKVLPIFNRMAIFSTTSTSYHGHPDPLTCPEGMSRKSIAMYYYTNGRPENEIIAGLEEHTTIFKPRDQNEKIAKNWRVIALKIARETIPPFIYRKLSKWAGKS